LADVGRTFTGNAWNGIAVDKKLRRYYTDLLFSAKIGRRRVLIYVLVEHKSGNYRLTALQILGYAHAIWTRHHRDHPHERLLPPILPFVLHHGERAFTSPTNLRELIDLRGLPAELVALQPDVRFVLDDLATQTEAQLRDRVASTFAQLALLCMQQLRTADAAGAEAMLRSWAALTEQLADAKNGQDDLLALLSYILQIGCLPEAGCTPSTPTSRDAPPKPCSPPPNRLAAGSIERRVPIGSGRARRPCSCS